MSFVGRAFSVEVIQTVPNAYSGETDLNMVTRGDGSGYDFSEWQGTLSLDYYNAVTSSWDSTTVSYDSNADRFWRLRHDSTANTMNWDVSSDGANWTTLRTYNNTEDLSSTQLMLQSGSWGPGSTDVQSIYENLNFE